MQVCDTGKKIYKSESEAKHVRQAIYHTRKLRLRIYSCDKCFGWHLTKMQKHD